MYLMHSVVVSVSILNTDAMYMRLGNVAARMVTFPRRNEPIAKTMMKRSLKPITLLRKGRRRPRAMMLNAELMELLKGRALRNVFRLRPCNKCTYLYVEYHALNTSVDSQSNLRLR